MHRWIWWSLVLLLLGLAAFGFTRHKAEQLVSLRVDATPRPMQGAAASAPPTSPTDPVVAAPRAIGFGLTFGVVSDASLPAEAVHLSCQGEPIQVDRPTRDNCDSSQGDTSCRTVLPVLCERPSGADPAAASDPGKPQTWVHVSLAATQPVMGAILESPAAASSLCVKELGEGWSMAEFEPGPDGGALQGLRGMGLSGNHRYWVHAKGRNANCWNSAP